MKRRDFLSSAGSAGLAAGATSSHARNANGTTPLLRLEGEYYRHHPVDFSKGTEGALGFEGWGEHVDIEVPAAETALVPMHVWNIGFSPELPFSPDGRAGGVMKMLEWASRSAPIIRREHPPILEAARGAGIRVIHVASAEHYARNYPGYFAAREIAGREPDGLPKAPGHGDIRPPDDHKEKLLFGEEYARDIDWYAERIDFPEPARPLDDEYVVVTTHQFNEVLRHHGIWNLIYIGFAINWCLWFSPCGMTDMSRLGYRCNCIEEAVTAVENRESVEGEFNKKQAMWRTSLMFGYIHHADDFIRACGRISG